MAGNPPAFGAYTFNGSAWVPTPGSGTANALPGTPPPVALYGFNGSAWVPSNGGGASQIAQQTLAASVSSITFSNIPQNFTNLQIIWTAATNRSSVFQDNLDLMLNGDNAAHYGWQFVGATTGTTPVAGNGGGLVSTPTCGSTAAANAPGYSGSTILTLPSYSGTTFAKTFLSQIVRPAGSTGAAWDVISITGGWTGTAAITTVTLTPETGASLIAGSVFTLYGLQ